jgi:hypothetical protein
VMIGIRDLMEKNTALSWHPAVYEAEWIFPFVILGVPFVMFILFACSAWYFLHARRQNGTGT